MEAFMEEFQHLKIPLEEIKSATRNFHNYNIIGSGGFGKVYQGVLCHSKGQSMVALKRLDRSYGQGDTEFWKEILMLSRYTHENLVALVGFCDEDDEKILVYEHVPRGSLDRYLSTTTLTWRQRLNICLAAAMGLSYLHDPKETRERVIHRDIKSSNILLDENCNAKISDMGLSKIGPANQQHTLLLVSSVVGTLGYIDPMYMETSILTKESDVYSFGVVLFEVLCGRLCFEKHNGGFQTLVRMWKKSYKEKKLDEIIFQDMKQHMDPRSLETFSDIAYQCLQKTRERRPKISDVVEKLVKALWFQEDFEDVEAQVDYEEMTKTAIPPLVYRSQEELSVFLSKGILVNGAKTWFMLNNNGEHSEMISAAECLIPINFDSPDDVHYGRVKSRFPWGYYIPFYSKFKTHVRTQFLSRHVTYTVNLVFHMQYKSDEYLGLNYILAGETKFWSSYLAYEREDGWLAAELYQFTSDGRNIDLEIMFECPNPLAVEGIEFQPLERVEHQVLEDHEEVDMPNTYWEQKLPSDYGDIIKCSYDHLHWTTKKELYSILCKGFPVIYGEEWFSLAKSGKKCHMVPARVALFDREWKWRSSPISTSRFEEVACDPHENFSIECRSKMLSPQTTYAVYLVYKLQETHSGFEHRIKVTYVVFYGERNHSWYIYLLNPQIPVIRPKVYQNRRNPLNRTKIKGLAQQRDDGWMEVQVWEFQSTTDPRVSKTLLVTTSDNMSLKGLIVQGIEFKAI